MLSQSTAPNSAQAVTARMSAPSARSACAARQASSSHRTGSAPSSQVSCASVTAIGVP